MNKLKIIQTLIKIQVLREIGKESKNMNEHLSEVYMYLIYKNNCFECS